MLNGVTFELAPGESLAIVGPSGSGKSTLATHPGRLPLSTAGKVRLDGTELRNWDRRQFGEFTGYLPQEVELFPGTIKENICRMRNDFPTTKIYEAAVFAGIHDMICQLPNGYETVLSAAARPYPAARSNALPWHARSLAIRRWSCSTNPIPTWTRRRAGFDRDLQRAKKRAVTVVVITLRPALLNIVDKVLILRAGRPDAFGPPRDVLRRLLHGTNNPQPVPSAPRPVEAVPAEPARAAPHQESAR